MKNWHLHFQDVFFNTWKKKGLPAIDTWLQEYDQLRSQCNFPGAALIAPQPANSPLDPAILNNVYGFGAVVAVILTELMGYRVDQTAKAIDWCGRFNLGISLFDYIADEAKSHNLETLDVFQAFSGKSAPAAKPAHPAEQFLTELATGVLKDLQKVTANSSDDSGKKNSALKSIQKMFTAEMLLSSLPLSEQADLKLVKRSLYLKSAQPFVLMSEYITSMVGETNENTSKVNRAIGKSLGCCYWLIDDAKDVWTDLEAGHWNWLLQAAAAKKADLFSEKWTAFREIELTKTWYHHRVAEQVTNRVINQLLHAVADIAIPGKSRERALGLVGASVWKWYKF